MGNIIELIFIVDCSKAMNGKEFETVSSINSIIDSYRRRDEIVYVNTFAFHKEARMLHDRLKIETVKPMTISDFKAGGDAALYDAVGIVINHFRNIHHYIRTEDIPYKTIFHIYSSGLENASVKYNRSDIRVLIEQQKKNCKWKFFFENENIFTARNELILAKEPQTEIESVINDSDFATLMKILGNSKLKW